MRTVIIGYPDSREGDDALALGEQLAAVLGARPLVVTVLPAPGMIAGEDLERALEEMTHDRFEVARDRLGVLGVETRAIAEASPARGLHDLAEREEASVIVLGSTHRGPIGRVLLGSTGESLLRGAPCAVAVAPRGLAEREERRLRRIGVAYDGSEESRVALETGIGVAARLHAELEVLVAVPPSYFGYEAAYSILTAEEVESYERKERQRLLDEALAAAPDGLAIKGRLLDGPPGIVLAEASQELDLLVAGSRGYGPVKRAILGSVSAQLIREAGSAVLIVPRGAGDDPLGVREQLAGEAT